MPELLVPVPHQAHRKTLLSASLKLPDGAVLSMIKLI
jgi:hypothetical protein